MKAIAFEGKEIEVETGGYIPRVGEYGVYLGKIWRAVQSSGAGNSFRITLEREFSNERITLKGFTPEIKELKKIFSPTGYIKL